MSKKFKLAVLVLALVGIFVQGAPVPAVDLPDGTINIRPSRTFRASAVLTGGQTMASMTGDIVTQGGAVQKDVIVSSLASWTCPTGRWCEASIRIRVRVLDYDPNPAP